jgi:hypothetical protein
VYSGPSPRNLALSVLVHGAAIAALFNVSNPAAEPDAHLENGRPTEIRISGKLYYVAQLDGSQSGSSGSPLPNSNAPKSKSLAEGRSGGIAAPRAASAGRSPKPARAATPSPEPSPAREPAQARLSTPVATPAAAANPAPAPTPEKIRPLRQAARAFIPPEVHPTPLATQTLIQPLSPPNLTPPNTPLPNFRVFTDLKQMRKIPKPFQNPGRRTPPRPAQAPDIATPALELVAQPPAPVGDPLTVLSMSDHPIPFSDKVVVPPGNIAPLPHESSGPAAASGTTPGTSTAGSGTAPSASNAAPAGASANGGGLAGSGSTGSAASNGSAAGSSTSNGGSAAGNGRAGVGNGIGAALVGGSPDGNLVAVVGGNGASPGSKGPGTGANGLGLNGAGAGASENSGTGAAGSGTGAGAGAGSGAGTGVGSGAGAGRTAPGSPTINRPPSGTFDAVVVQSSPVDQYPESRGLLSGRPIYSVYVSMGTARDWTLFFCVPGEKPQSGNGPVVVLGPMGAPVRAPYPTRTLKPAIKLPSYEKYVLVHGLVNKDGKFEGLRMVRPIRPETDQALLAALANWEFRAATRDGVAIAVEFLLSIPATGL